MTDSILENNDEFKPLALFHGEVDKTGVLARYAESRAVRIVASRLKLTDRGEHRLNDTEALVIGQAALATGLSPFQPQPELWYWVRVKDGKRTLTLMRSRDGTEMLADRAARNAGNHLLPPRYREITDDKERARLGIPAGALASEASVENYLDTRSYYQRRNQLKDEGMSSTEIDKRLGKSPPCHTGIGILETHEIQKFSKGYGAKMPHINRVRKRAKTEAQKPWAARLDLMALMKDRSPDLDDYIVEGEWMDILVEEMSPEKIAEMAKEGAATLYGLDCPACGAQLNDPPPMDCPHCGVKGIGHKLATVNGGNIATATVDEAAFVDEPDEEIAGADKKTKPEPEIKPGEVSDPRTFTDPLLDKIVEARLAPDIEEAKSVLKRSPWASKSVTLRGHKKVVLWYRLYLAEVDRGADPAKAARIATSDMGAMA